MTSTLLIAAFAMGFFGSPHCLGMCGGLVTAFGLSMQEVSSGKKRALVATYHLGRLLSYAFLGIIASLIGIAVLAPIMVGNSLPRILLGLVLVFIGLTMLGAPFLNRLEKMGMGLWQKLSPLRQKVFPITTFPRALAAGLLWGFLPCGLVYGALMMAVVGGNNVAFGALLMFVFGLGTVPMLVATQETVGWLHKQIGRFRLRQLNGVVMILSGAAVIALPAAMHHFGIGGHDHGHAHGSHQAAHQGTAEMTHAMHSSDTMPQADANMPHSHMTESNMPMHHTDASHAPHMSGTNDMPHHMQSTGSNGNPMTSDTGSAHQAETMMMHDDHANHDAHDMHDDHAEMMH